MNNFHQIRYLVNLYTHSIIAFSNMPEVSLMRGLFLGLTLLQMSSAQFFLLDRGGKSAGEETWARQSQCPQVERRSLAECAGQRSTCWSPGTLAKLDRFSMYLLIHFFTFWHFFYSLTNKF